ncbi:hypothetical protein V2I01_10960 [Micromonospora sp. BRA006-A]|nr:hypothetical protein [Micromonospora sp. BRA006-A]
MALIPGQIVTPPEPGLRRYGLFNAASGPLDLPAPHGEGAASGTPRHVRSRVRLRR